MISNLQTIRDGRNAARFLGQLTATSSLTKADAERLLAKINAAFDQVLGPVEADKRQPFAVIQGGRP
jgi:hypothetical protein